MMPVTTSRVMTTADASQVCAFSLGKGRFDMLIGDTRKPPSAARVGWEGGDRNGE